MHKKFPLIPVALIVVGVFFLGKNLGLIQLDGNFFTLWWPVIPLALGVWLLAKRRPQQGQ